MLSHRSVLQGNREICVGKRVELTFQFAGEGLLCDGLVCFEGMLRYNVSSLWFSQHLVELTAEVVDGFSEWSSAQVTIPCFHRHAFGDIPCVGIISCRTSE